MKILITGGAGFIGSHLADELLKRKNEVVVVDNLSTGSIDNVKHLKTNKKFSIYIDSIMNEGLMKKLVAECDEIFHLAAAVGVKFIIDNPLESIEINVKGTEIILKLANEFDKKKVILASTSEIYGKNVDGHKRFREDDDRVLGTTSITRWSYSCTKAVDEFLALAYYREKKLPVVIVRLFNTCGPRQTGRYGMVVPRFVKHALLNQPITVYGNGRQTRSFTHVSDVVEALIALSQHSKAEGQVFNIGNNKPISIIELAEKVKKMTNSSSEIVFIPYDKAYEKGFEDMMHRQPDLTRIQDLIGYSPKFDIDRILKGIIEGFEK